MRKENARAGEQTLPLLALVVCFWLVCAILCVQMDWTFAGPSDYNSYTLQAMAWREGRVSLGEDTPHLELAVYEGDWYVSFPPVPSVPMYFLSFLFGYDTPDALMVKLYAMIAIIAVYFTLVRRGMNGWHAAFLALMMGLGGSMLPLVMDGAVWYQAQVLAFCLTVSAIALMNSGRTTPALFLYALAVGCRPFNACCGPLMMLLWYLRRKNRSLKAAAAKLWPGIVLGLMVAAAYGAYNYIRFGDIFEFGHNYLPEFTRSATGQFSVKHLAANAKRFLLGLPVRRTAEGWAFEQFGCSVFLGNPMLMLLIVWFITDLFRRRMNAEKCLVMLFFAVHLFLLLLHRTGGGFQLGARYAVDLVPYSLMYLGTSRERRGVSRWEAPVLLAGFAFMMMGSVQVHI